MSTWTFCFLTKQLLQFILKIVGLLLGECQVVITPHVFPVPQCLEHLPLFLDAQPLCHGIGQQCRLRAGEQRLVVLVHVTSLLCLPLELHRLVGGKFVGQAL